MADNLRVFGLTYNNAVGIKMTDTNGNVLTYSRGETTEDEPVKDVNFVDYDGTILHSYTVADFGQLSALPNNPVHNGLTSQGWNWTLADINTQLSDAPGSRVWVGQQYITESGDTEIDIELDSYRLSLYLALAVNGTVTIDWGDNTATNTVTGSSLTTRVNTQHVYSSGDIYTIKISVVSGEFTFYGSNNLALLHGADESGINRTYPYSNAVKEIRIGRGVSTIGSYAFRACWCLKKITIPNTITLIQDGAFYYSHVCEVTIPRGISEFCSSSSPGSTFQLTEGIVCLPHTITTIGYRCFYNSYQVPTKKQRTVSIPSNVTAIGNGAFAESAPNTCIIIPPKVTQIDTGAFSGYHSLEEVHLLRNIPPTLGNTSTFSSAPSDAVFYVPYSVDHSILNAYKTATNWSTFADKMVEEPA